VLRVTSQQRAAGAGAAGAGAAGVGAAGAGERAHTQHATVLAQLTDPEPRS
jgi:hypothetical protein